jgi:hypothetical protein
MTMKKIRIHLNLSELPDSMAYDEEEDIKMGVFEDYE